MPDAVALSHSGTMGEAGEQKPYTVDNLTPETIYTVAAVAFAGDEFSEVASVTMATGSSPLVTLSIESDPTFLTASFSACAFNSDRAAYLILEKDQPVPAADDILSSGIRFDPDSEEHTFDLNSLIPGTDYIVAAAAENSSAVSDPVIVEFSTLAEPAYQYTAECIMAGGSYYGDMNNQQGTGEFFLVLTDVESDENGYAASAGYILQLDLFSQLAEENVGAKPLSGIYRFVSPLPGEQEGEFYDVCTEWSIGGVSSVWRETDQTGHVINYGQLVGAVAEFVIEGEDYRIVAYATGAAGRGMKFTWEGPCKFVNRIPGELQDVNVTDFPSAEAEYYGRSKTDGSSDEFVVRLSDAESDAQCVVTLDFYAPPCSDPTRPAFAPGTYSAGQWLATDPYTFWVGQNNMGVYYSGSFVEMLVDEVWIRGYILGGSFRITDVGDGKCTFDLDLTMQDEEGTLTKTVRGSYTARIPIDNKYPIPPGDATISADRVYAAWYVDQPASGGGYNYRIELLDTEFVSGDNNNIVPASGGGNHVMLDLYGTQAPDAGSIVLPEGTYWLDYSQMPFTCHGQYTLVEYFDFNGNLLPLTFWSAKVTVVHEDNGYRISMEGEDVLNEKIVCNYSGPIEFTRRADGPAATGRVSAGRAAPRKVKAGNAVSGRRSVAAGKESEARFRFEDM